MMTVDFVIFDMTLELLRADLDDKNEDLGQNQTIKDFFKSYDSETVNDLCSMKGYMIDHKWEELKRLCHTWKGRNAQIGFSRSADLAATFYDFLQRSLMNAGYNTISSQCCTLIQGQSTDFYDQLERESDVIRTFLQSKSIL